jgi:DNA-binding PadR family transcriptional regulator
MSLRFAILGLLARDELSGYEITKRFARSVGYCWQAHSQQIYPELVRLEDEAMVTSRVIAQASRPDKRLYALADAGRESLREWVTTPSPLTLRKDDFMVKVYSYGIVEAADAIAALRAHRRQHEERLAAYRAIAVGLGDRPAEELPDDVYGAFLALQCGVQFEEGFIAWHDEAERLLRLRAGRAGVVIGEIPGEPRAEPARRTGVGAAG